MDRLKRSVLKTAALATPIQDAPTRAGTQPVAPALQVHPHIGALGISNAALGDVANAALPVCLTTLGDQSLMSDLGQVSSALSELRLVQLSDLTKREVIIGRLPLTVQTSVVEDWQSLYESASNPTKWYRQPFVIIVMISAESVDDYKSRLRRRLLTLRERIGALPGGVAAKLCIVCIRRASAQSDESLLKVHQKVADEFGKADAVMRLDTAVEHMQSSSGSRDWEQVKKRLETCFSAVFVQRLAAYETELKSLSTALDGPISHFLHHFLVQDALATLFQRAQMHSDAIQQNWLMEVSFENHVSRHPEMHLFQPNLSRDLNTLVGNMPQDFLRHAVLPDGRMNTFVMQSYLFGTRLQMIFHAVRKAQVDVQCRQRVMPDVADFATQALQFIANTAAHLQSLQLEGQLPALFSQVWTAVTGLAIASTLAAALKTEAKAFQLSQQHDTDDDEFNVTSAYAEKPITLTSSNMSGGERDEESLKKLLPYQVQPSKLASSLEMIVAADGGVAAAAARSAECAHSNRVHLIVAQVLASAYVALVEVGEALGLRSALHPRLADTTPIASSLTDMQLEGRALETAEDHHGSSPLPASSLTVQLMTNAATGELRENEVLVPFDMMHLGLGADVPPWLAESVLATQLSEAAEFEYLLTVLATTAASCFLQAGVLRHATYLASLAANYLFRADEPDVAISLWGFVSRAMIDQGWRHIAVVNLDKLLATACLLRHEITAACALQLLSIAPKCIAAAFPGAHDAALKLQACAWHALQHFCEPTDLDLPETLFVDVRKSQTSLFYGKVAADGVTPLLQPPAASPVSSGGDDEQPTAGAQRTGLAQHCTVRICVTSALPMPVQLASLQLHLQHIIHSPAAPQVSDSGTAATQPPASRRVLSQQTLQNGNESARGTMVDDVASTVSTRRKHRRRASSVFSGVAGRNGPARKALSGTSLDGPSLADAGSESPPQSATVLRDWTDGSNVQCQLASDTESPVVLRPGNNMFSFRACPVYEGVHLLDCVVAELDCAARHCLYLEARVAGDMADAAPSTQPFGAALVATAGAETLDVVAVLPGGALYESCCHWVGVRLCPRQCSVQDITLRVALSSAGSGDMLDFAHIEGHAADPAQSSPQSGPPHALWECGTDCLVVHPSDDGELALPGSVAHCGTLWLPVACKQRARQAECVDIGDEGIGTEAEAEGTVPVDAAMEVAVGYWSDCWRTKHVRLRVPVQSALHASSSATPISSTSLALQLTLRSDLPVPLEVFQQTLELQAGLQHTSQYFSGPKPPFTIPAGSTHLSLCAVTLDTEQAAANVAQLVTLLHLAYTIPAAAVSALPLVAVSDKGCAGGKENTRSEHLPVAAAQCCLRMSADGADDASGRRVQHSRLASEGCFDFKPSDAFQNQADGAGASVVSAFTHKLTLELSSFAAMAALQQGPESLKGEGKRLCAPSITFMGPMRLAAGRDASLMWRIRWPKSGSEELIGDSTDDNEARTLRYEVYVPSGWQRTRRHKGTLRLTPGSNAFATVTVSAAAAVAGRITSPTLVVMPEGAQPVRSAATWLQVSEEAVAP